MRELGLAASPLTVASHYDDLIDGFVLDQRDTDLAGDFELPVHTCNTWMKTLADREALAMTTLNFAASLRTRRGAAA
jgi:LPPG:FO 2-phospho-L-lactate transferase